MKIIFFNLLQEFQKISSRSLTSFDSSLTHTASHFFSSKDFLFFIINTASFSLSLSRSGALEQQINDFSTLFTQTHKKSIKRKRKKSYLKFAEVESIRSQERELDFDQ